MINKTAIIGAAMALGLFASQAVAGPVKVGTITCDFEPNLGLLIGSSTDGSCEYVGLDGDTAIFNANRTRVGVDVGFTNGTTLVWAVLAVGKSEPEALRGYYAGVGADASIGIGLGVNALVGGLNETIVLQPISTQGQSGLNAALTVQAVTLY